MKFDAQLTLQIVDKGRDGFARIHLLVVKAMQSGAMMAELATVQRIHFCTAQ